MMMLTADRFACYSYQHTLVFCSSRVQIGHVLNRPSSEKSLKTVKAKSVKGLTANVCCRQIHIFVYVCFLLYIVHYMYYLIWAPA